MPFMHELTSILFSVLPRHCASTGCQLLRIKLQRFVLVSDLNGDGADVR